MLFRLTPLQGLFVRKLLLLFKRVMPRARTRHPFIRCIYLKTAEDYKAYCVLYLSFYFGGNKTVPWVGF